MFSSPIAITLDFILQHKTYLQLGLYHPVVSVWAARHRGRRA